MARGPAIIPVIVQQHAEDVAVLHACRTALTRAPHSALRYIRRFDDRLAAHLDGLRVAGEEGWPLVETALARLDPSVMFVVSVRAVEDRNQERLDRVIAISAGAPELRRGLISAMGWLEREQLQGIVARLLSSDDAFKQWIGVAACSVHRVNPSAPDSQRSFNSGVDLRSRSLRGSGELGLLDALPVCASAIDDEDRGCRFWAAWSAVLLGNRGVALEVVSETAMTPGPERPRAFGLALQAMTVTAAHGVLQSLAREADDLRWLIQGSGIAGDPTYVPWLIGHMANDQAARLAGEAFSLITGTDLALLDLDRKPPENFESGPNDDPDDPNVQMDPDDGLPWPDPERIQKWWAVNDNRFQPGTRYFMGAPVTREHCIDVLKNGYQRQRILAAHYLCLLDPGTPLFNTSAPAWRQQRLLAEMR